MNQRTLLNTPRLLRPLQLVAVVFFTVSGGPYGLEPLLGYVGGETALFLVLLTPVLWCVPAMLMVMELNSMLPKTGGYYQWVKQALGLRWGFFEGWWSWLYTFVDLAIYPVLFVQYFSFFFPHAEAYTVPICLLIIWGCAALNLLGIVPVGRTSVALGIGVLVPFGILFAYSLFDPATTSFATLHMQSHPFGFTAFGMGLYTVMWNFLGWDNPTSFAEEVHQPVRSYVFAMIVAFVLILTVYALSILTGATAGLSLDVLQADGFPSLGLHVGGQWLGALLSLGGMASAIGLFLSILLSISRIPNAMADDGLLPPMLSKLHPRFKTPYVSIIVCTLVVSVMVLWGFADLLIIDVTLYGCGLGLEFIALIVLRMRLPDVPRPFKIPLNTPGLVLLMIFPLICFGVALSAMFSANNVHLNATMFAVAAVLTAPAVWMLIRGRASGGTPWIARQKLSYACHLSPGAGQVDGLGLAPVPVSSHVPSCSGYSVVPK
jgi:amino acid transporter